MKASPSSAPIDILPAAAKNPAMPAAAPTTRDADEATADYLTLPPPPPPLPPLVSRPAVAVRRPAVSGFEPAVPDARPVRYARPSFNCRFARSRAELMVCGDARLAATDQRLDASYERAIQAGASRRALRSEQDDWLLVREEAAYESAEALTDVYEQRIAELDEIAGDRW